MIERRHLPPQIRRIELARRSGGKPVVRYQLTVDTGVHDGKRQQFRRRYATEKEARPALAEIQGQVIQGNYIHPSTMTVDQACADWLLSRHNVKPTTAAGYEQVLQPVRSELGQMPVQTLTRRDIDDLVRKLRAGGLRRSDGRLRTPWSPRSCNYMLTALRQVLAQLVAEGRLTRNVALLVDRIPGKPKRFETFTADQVQVVLDGVACDRNRHAWHLALAGLRRGAISGQRWADVDFDNNVIRIGCTRVDVRASPSIRQTRRPNPPHARYPFQTCCAKSSRPRKPAKPPRSWNWAMPTPTRGMWSATRPASPTTHRL
jgi:integrase